MITGTTSGTGLVAARTVAELGGEAVLLNRSSKRVDAMLRSLKEAVPYGKFVAIECDLQNFETVRKAANEIKSRYDAIYCLANNAGIMATPDEATVDGYDTQMQTNHLSHFLLTAELFPLLEAEAEANSDARIVNHSSFGRLHTPNDRLEEKYFGKKRGQSWRLARGCSSVEVVEDLADEVGIGDIRYDPQLSAAERAKADVYFKDALQSLRPGQWCGGWIVAVRRPAAG